MEDEGVKSGTWPYPLPDPINNMQLFANQCLLDSGNPYLFHEDGSPYLGLPLYKQKVLAKIRRGGTRTKKFIKKRMRKATKEDYVRLLLRCIEAYIHAWWDNSKRLDRITILMKIPFNFRSLYKNKDFPRVTIVAYDDWSVYVSVKADSIVNYLYTHGHCPFDSKTMRKSLWAILQEQRQLDFYYEHAAPISIVEKYAEIVGQTVEGKIVPRTQKGKGKFSKYRARKPVDKTEKM